MWKFLLISVFTLKEKSDFNIGKQKIYSSVNCKKQIDTLTKRQIYIEADILPEPSIGEGAFRSRLEREIITPTDVSPENFNSNIKVAFIVNLDGSITGERIITAKSEIFGRQLLKIAKAIKWVPGQCKGKKVAMLYIIPLIIDILEE